MKKGHLHIAIASDTNYVRCAVVLLASLFYNNKDFERITVHLLSKSIDVYGLYAIREQVEIGGGELKVYDVSDIEDKLKIVVPSTISIAAYSRLFLGSLVDSTISKIIYMDVDAIVNGGLTELWSIDTSEFQVAGVLDDVELYAKRMVGMNDDASYINSGFLLINLDKWRADHIEERILEFLVKNNGNVYHHDQGLINAVCEKKLILPIKYNMVTNFYVFPFSQFTQTPFYSKSEMEDAKQRPTFIHFTAGVANRPWMKNCKHPLRALYIKYLMGSCYPKKELDEDNRPFKLRFLSYLFYNIRPLYYFMIIMRSKLIER